MVAKRLHLRAPTVRYRLLQTEQVPTRPGLCRSQTSIQRAGDAWDPTAGEWPRAVPLQASTPVQ
jgi:hypothetical protein